MIPLRGISVCLAVVVCTALSADAQTIQINRENKTIAISATDEATATADLAAITVGFEIYGPDADSTYAEGGKLSKTVLDAVRMAGIDEKSIESGIQGLARNTRFDNWETPEQYAQKQFVFQQSWTVSTDPKRAADVIRFAIAAGANTTGQIEWRLADRKTLQAKAAEAALVKARAVAAEMAAGLNVKVGALIYASNETPNTRIYFAGSRGVGGNAGGGMYSQLEAAPALEIRPQTMREEATVYAVFAIE